MFHRMFRTTWTPKRLQQWEKVRVKGKQHFVLRRGVILWGSFMFVWMSLWQVGYWYIVYHTAPPAVVLGITISMGAILYPLGGWLWATIMWGITERSYQAHQQHDPSILPPQSDSTRIR